MPRNQEMNPRIRFLTLVKLLLSSNILGKRLGKKVVYKVVCPRITRAVSSIAYCCCLFDKRNVRESLGAQAGLGRSWTLTDGIFGKVFGTSFVIGIVVILRATLPQLAATYSLEFLLPNVDIVSLVETILAQVSVVVMVILYFDLPVHKEVFDLEWQVWQASATE
jgi:hypothetical protein